MTPADFSPLLTERLCLRLPRESDAPALLALYGDSRVMDYWSHVPWTLPAQAFDAVAEAHADLARGCALHLAITASAHDGLVGSCALFDIVPQHRRATLGYLLAPHCWGQGLGREALDALIGYGFDDLRLGRIEAEVDPRNRASRALLMRLGFRLEGLLHARWCVGGQARDVELWALLRRDWPA
jgi:ribosomal-protein-alanine N-acetyltransferase